MRTRTAPPGFFSLLFIMMMVCFSVVFPWTAWSAVPAGKMTTDPSQLWSPGRLAADLDGTLYVVDGYKNRVQKFSAGGAYLGSIKVARPSAVAAAPDGTLYIGSHADYSVGIYRSGEMTGYYLGAGKNEFTSISDIAVDKSTGDIYVVDTKKNTVKVYDSAGVKKGELTGFTAPAAAAVTDTEVYILDAPAVSCPDTIVVDGISVPCTDCTSCSGSRISVVDKTGKPLRSVTESGAQAGMMIRPVALAVDAAGNIYVADTLRKSVLVYDRLLAFVGEMTSGQGDLHAPVSLALSRDGSLYVSSSETRSCVEVGLAGALHFAPGVSLDFKSKTGAALSPGALGY